MAQSRRPEMDRGAVEAVLSTIACPYQGVGFFVLKRDGLHFSKNEGRVL
jgi:hypothetical protein